MFIPNETKQALTGSKIGNRSLYFDRFADPQLREERRKAWFETGCKTSVPSEALKRSRDSFCPPGTQFLYAQLKARLMVNMSGGVMENAGLCLDRFGLPYIPGSAVKGCTRRAALRALREWTQTGQAMDPESPCSSVTQLFESPATMLRHIAQIFGWSESDWTAHNSDFLWAASTDQDLIHDAALSGEIRGIKRCAGAVAFLPAYPNTDPGLELDILTCHHPDYYGNFNVAFAADTEDPNPVTFPAVRAQNGDDYFAFAVAPLRSAGPRLLEVALAFLRLGLETFGVGAKTASGYGWFEAHETHQKVLRRFEIRRLEAESLRAKEEMRLQEEAKRARAAQLQKELANLSEPEKQDRFLADLSEQQFNQKLLDFLKKERPEQEAIVRALRGPRAQAWSDLVQRAQKKPKPFTQIADQIRSISKALNLGKMP